MCVQLEDVHQLIHVVIGAEALERSDDLLLGGGGLEAKARNNATQLRSASVVRLNARGVHIRRDCRA